VASSDELSPRGRQALALLEADVRRFQRMVRDLLEISRPDGGSDLALEEVEVGELIFNAVSSSARSVPDSQVPRIAVDPAVAHARMWVDKRRFERIIGNLLENAALYGGGADTVQVDAGTSQQEPTVCIAVSDHGPGVASTERQHIFERFYRGQASGRRGAGTGTGLGLALVAEHVRLHHGQVWVEDAPGGGARFVIELPLAEEAMDVDRDGPDPDNGAAPERRAEVATEVTR
jgi:two-component system, OmpR family, sensor histidine kinase MtrB